MEWLTAHYEVLTGLITIIGAFFAGLSRLHKLLIRSMAVHFASKRDVQVLGHKIDHMQRVLLNSALDRTSEVRRAREHT